MRKVVLAPWRKVVAMVLHQVVVAVSWRILVHHWCMIPGPPLMQRLWLHVTHVVVTLTLVTLTLGPAVVTLTLGPDGFHQRTGSGVAAESVAQGAPQLESSAEAVEAVPPQAEAVESSAEAVPPQAEQAVASVSLQSGLQSWHRGTAAS